MYSFVPAPLTLEDLAELEQRHRSPAARRLLTEVWRLRLIENRADQFIRILASDHVALTPMQASVASALCAALGLPTDQAEIRKALPSEHTGGWGGRRIATCETLALESKLGRQLTPIEWGEVMDRLTRD
jgi:hypothetical protein